MPIPGSILNGMAFDPVNLGSLAYSSLCTFYGITKTTAPDGQEIHSFAVIDGAHTNIPCRMAPNILIRPQLQEKRSGPFEMSDAKFQVNLDKYVADASDEWQLMVDGVLYEILAVERDGNLLTSRIGIGKIIPFNS